ncbi:reverse transcriptase domain-containing protein [Tanacetum coccineum]
MTFGGFGIAGIIGQTKDIYSDMGDDVDISALTIEQYLALIQDNNRPGIVKPKIGDDVEFEINSNFMRELRRKLFAGTDDEDAHEHSISYYPQGAGLEVEKRLPAGVINTWDLLEKEFIWQYCSPFKTAKKLKEIRNFKQEMCETLYQAWERYNDLLFKCPQHDLNNHQKVQIFYTGLDISTRRMLDSRGFIPLMTPTQALKSIQVMADHSHNWYDEITTRKKINDSPNNVDAIQASFKGEHLAKECHLEKEVKTVEQIHKIKDREDEGDMDVNWDITVKDVERLRQFLTPTIHTLPNPELAVQPYMPLGPVYDKENIIREEEQDYDIPLHDGVMQPLAPQIVHITPPDDDYVAPATNPILE